MRKFKAPNFEMWILLLKLLFIFLFILKTVVYVEGVLIIGSKKGKGL